MPIYFVLSIERAPFTLTRFVAHQVVRFSIFPVWVHKVQDPGSGAGAPSNQSPFPYLPRTREAFCFGPAPCPTPSLAEAAVPPACPRRGKRERGRTQYLAAAG